VGFGLSFAALWNPADLAAKTLAGTIAVGAKVIGQVPAIVAWKENAEDSIVESAYEAGAKTVMSVRKTVAVTATEWTGWMNVKAAELVEGVGQMAGVQMSAGPAKMQAALDNLASQKEWEEKQAASNAALGSMRDKVNQANAQRSAAAQQLKQKIVGAGKATADAINSARKYADALAVKGIVRGVFGVIDVFQAVKAKFSKAPTNSPVTHCPEVDSPSEKLRAQIVSQEALLKGAKEAAKHGPNAAALNAAIPDLEKHIDVSKKALLAADVYDAAAEYDAKGSDKKYHAKKDVAPGCDRLGDDEIKALGLDPKDFHPDNSEFRAEIYKCGDRYALVFKGTTKTSEQDWENNALQNFGLDSDYYTRAQRLANRVYQSEKIGSNLDIIGHSLGGGLASAAVARINDPRVGAVVFNPAALNPDTVPDADLAEAGKRIDVYRVGGEILTTGQAIVSPVGLSPKAVGQQHEALQAQKGDSTFDKHSMPAVERGLLEKGAEPQQKIESLLEAGAVAVP
jgi:hypothetical protein